MTLDHHDEATANAMRVVARGLIAGVVAGYLRRDPAALAPFSDMDALDIIGIAFAMTAPPDDAEHAAAMEHLAKRGER